MRFREFFPSICPGWGRVTDAIYRPPGLQEEAPHAGQADMARCPQGPSPIKAWLQLAPSSPGSLALCVQSFSQDFYQFQDLCSPALQGPCSRLATSTQIGRPLPSPVGSLSTVPTIHQSEPDCPSWEMQAGRPPPTSASICRAGPLQCPPQLYPSWVHDLLSLLCGVAPQL